MLPMRFACTSMFQSRRLCCDREGRQCQRLLECQKSDKRGATATDSSSAIRQSKVSKGLKVDLKVNSLHSHNNNALVLCRFVSILVGACTPARGEAAAMDPDHDGQSLSRSLSCRCPDVQGKTVFALLLTRSEEETFEVLGVYCHLAIAVLDAGWPKPRCIDGLV